MSLIQAAIASIPFPQLPLMTKRRFALFLRQRGIGVGEKGVQALVDSHVVERLGEASACFHPFHIWPIARMLHNTKIDLSTSIRHYGLNVEATKKFVELQVTGRVKDWFEQFPKSIQSIDFNERLIPLLLWLESYYLPEIRGTFKRQKWQDWVKHIHLPDLLTRHSLSIDELRSFRNMILNDALWHDPAEYAYLLFRSMPFDKRDQFKGSLRIAYDLYEMAEILRLFVERVSGQLLTKEWDPTGKPTPDWAVRRYGGRIKFGDPVFTRSLAREYGLDPSPRVRWLVEGQTEEGFITRYAERIRMNLLQFVKFQPLFGDGGLNTRSRNLPDWLKAWLKSAYEEQCFATVTIDESARVRKNIDTFKKQRLINMPYVVNTPDFECATLERDQLLDVMCSWMAELSGSWIDFQSIRDEISRNDDGGNGAKTLINEFNKALKMRSVDGSIQVKKGRIWGSKMADYLSDYRDNQISNGTYSEESLSKIERQILAVSRYSQPFVDFSLSIKNISPHGLEIK